MDLIVAEDGKLVHENCGGEIARKRMERMQLMFCKSCNEGVMAPVVKLKAAGAKVNIGLHKLAQA